MLAWIECDKSRREVISRHASARASLIEKWLKGTGELLDPLLIAGNPPGQDAGGLLSIVLAALASSGAAVGANGSNSVVQANASTKHPRRLSVTVHSSAADSATISEVERRERTQVQSDAVALEDDAASMSRLQLMVRSSEAGDGGASLNKVVAAEPEGTLSRLLYSGADISSVTVDAEPSTVHAIAMVRGVLNAALERAVCGSNSTQPSDRLIRALGAIRLRRLARTALTAGATWEEVGEYYAAVIRRADRKADGFAGSPGAPEAPDPRWLPTRRTSG